MNILYFHRLDSSLGSEKRAILEKYGKVFSPAIDYRVEFNSIEMLVEQFKNQKIDVVIGSNMGGFVGYYVADAYQKPALLFNPSLTKRSVRQKIPIYKAPPLGFKQLVLGIRSDRIDPRGTLEFLSKNLQVYTNYRIHIRQNLGHEIPIDVFKEEVVEFFKFL
ncbi:MAG TPA: YqiA/YcfP family alpha/beta fold hydrolase [Aequorivita sp.]|nr:YqiA/YcfP family alpha/beta fold hydrolase [Aequorivita sp.]